MPNMISTRRPCETQLLVTINDTAKELGDKSQVDVVLLEARLQEGMQYGVRSPSLEENPALRHLCNVKTLDLVTDFINASFSFILMARRVKSQSSPLLQGNVFGISLFRAFTDDDGLQ